jgi:lipoprotein-anchoring transpeptidase ErfK/SrfK
MIAGIKLLAGAAVIAVASTAGVATAAPADARQPHVTSVHGLAALLRKHRLFASPSTGSTRVGAVQSWRPITGSQTVLPVISRTTRDGVHWLRVRAPGRPNGTKAWMLQAGTALSTTSWSIVIKTSSRRLLVYRYGRLVRSFGAIVGKASTPTPHGHFFVEESVRMLPGAPGGPFALALSARSNVFQEFEGGPGQIAIHGIANLGGTLGTAASHGCVRVSNRSVSWLVTRVPAGAPVAIGR